MAETSTIEWTDATWNPITGCSVLSPGCTNCYAMKLAGGRLQGHPSRTGLTTPSKAGPVWNGHVRLNEVWLKQPLQWARPRKIFVCAHGDLFHESVPDAWIDKVFAVMALAPHHTFQVLTKRADRMRAYFERLAAYVESEGDDPELTPRCFDHVTVAITGSPCAGGAIEEIPWPLPNVWLGVSAEDQEHAEQRIPDLLATPAAVRFLSAEPLLGPLHLMKVAVDDQGAFFNALHGTFTNARRIVQAPYLDLVIAGGESGPDARPTDPRWVRILRDDCATAGTAFFFKQWGAWWPQECHPIGSMLEVFRIAKLKPSRAIKRGCWGADDRWHPGSVAGGPPAYTSWLVGKKAAGRLLDGIEHNAMPERRS